MYDQKNTIQICLLLSWIIVDADFSSHHWGLTSIDRECWRSSPLAYENLSKKLLQPRTILRHEHTGAHESSLRQGIEPAQTFASKWKVTHKQHLIAPLRIDLNWWGMLTLVSTCLWEFIQEVASVQAAVLRALAHRRQTRAQQATRHQQNRPKPLLPNEKLLINNISSNHCGLTSIGGMTPEIKKI